MHPTPCAHCGYNYMRHAINPNSINLCNNCQIREDIRTKKGPEAMTIDILLKCPDQSYAELEEYCINHGEKMDKFILDCALACLHQQSSKVVCEEECDPSNFSESNKKKSKK